MNAAVASTELVSDAFCRALFRDPARISEGLERPTTAGWLDGCVVS